MKVLDWDIMKNGAEELVKKKVVLYGTSSSGERMFCLLRNLNLQEKIICVCDTFENKWGNIWNDFTIMSPIEICNLSEQDVVVVICSAYEMEIYKHLMEIGCTYDIVGSIAYIHAVHHDIMNKKNQYFLKEIVERYKLMYELWLPIRMDSRDALMKNISNDFMDTLVKREKCVLVHSMHKTGNRTLVASLGQDPIMCCKHLVCESKKEKELLSKIIKTIHPEIKMFTGVRYPIERIISRKWQYLNAPWLYGDSYPDLTINSTTARIPEPMRSYSDVIKWFKEQVEELFGIDVFQYPFDIDKGYTIISKDNISIFLYRLDYLDKLEKEIGAFIEDNDFKLVKDNEAKNKSYALAYQEYLKEVEIDSKFFESLMSSKEVCHFYSEEERKKYRKKWLPYLK